MTIPERPLSPTDYGDCPENWKSECVQQDDNGKWYVAMSCDCSEALDLRDERNRGESI